jgi:hypothetical protein
MTTPPPPTFVIIGAQKSATRWLRMKLGAHPQIFTAEEELHFWNVPWRVRALGIEGYRAQFAGWDGEPIVGESTPGYMIWRHQPHAVALRMRDGLPDVRLIAILRNPIDRAMSAMLHHVKHHRIRQGARLLDVVREQGPPESDRLCLISGGWYAASLAPFMFRFDEQLLVLFHDDVVHDPAKPFAAALRHVGADPGFVPEQLSEVVFSNRSPEVDAASLSPGDRAELWQFFEDDVEHLEDLLGVDLSHWRPDASAGANDVAPPAVAAPRRACGSA